MFMKFLNKILVDLDSNSFFPLNSLRGKKSQLTGEKEEEIWGFVCLIKQNKIKK